MDKQRVKNESQDGHGHWNTQAKLRIFCTERCSGRSPLHARNTPKRPAALTPSSNQHNLTLVKAAPYTCPLFLLPTR